MTISSFASDKLPAVVRELLVHGKPNRAVRRAASCAVLFAVLIFLPQICAGQTDDRWVYIVSSVDKIDFYFDKTTIKTAGTIVTAWDKSVYLDGSYRLTLSEWDCARKRNRITRTNVYSSSRELIETGSGAEWLDVVPTSVSERMIGALCSGTVKRGATVGKTSAKTARVSVDVANIRELPALDAAIVGRASEGRILQLVGTVAVGGWYQIYTGEDETAWVHSSTIDLIAPAKNKER